MLLLVLYIPHQRAYSRFQASQFHMLRKLSRDWFFQSRDLLLQGNMLLVCNLAEHSQGTENLRKVKPCFCLKNVLNTTLVFTEVKLKHCHLFFQIYIFFYIILTINITSYCNPLALARNIIFLYKKIEKTKKKFQITHIVPQFFMKYTPKLLHLPLNIGGKVYAKGDKYIFWNFFSEH